MPDSAAAMQCEAPRYACRVCIVAHTWIMLNSAIISPHLSIVLSMLCRGTPVSPCRRSASSGTLLFTASRIAREVETRERALWMMLDVMSAMSSTAGLTSGVVTSGCDAKP